MNTERNPGTDRITMLGTGHAVTSKCFNTCFVYENENGKMLVDTGGGQQLIFRLREAGVGPEDISCVFLTHRHTDHLLGLPWLLRIKMHGPAVQPLEIISHPELCRAAQSLLTLLFPELPENIGKEIRFTPVDHGEKLERMGREFTFYDTGADTAKQFGFALTLSGGGSFVFNGDVPYCETNRELMRDARWLMHEAFCLEEEKKGRMKHHSSVAGAAENAARLNAEKLILVHGSDKENRKAVYTAEASRHFSGEIFVPDDLECIQLV